MQRSKLTQTQDLEPDSDYNFRMSTGPVTPLPQEPQVHDKRNMFGQRARYPISWAIRSVLRVFAEGSFISGGGARTEGQLPPFKVARRFTPRRCLSSRASYPLPRVTSVPSPREVHSASGADSAGPPTPSWTEGQLPFFGFTRRFTPCNC